MNIFFITHTCFFFFAFLKKSMYQVFHEEEGGVDLGLEFPVSYLLCQMPLPKLELFLQMLSTVSSYRMLNIFIKCVI